MPPRVLCCKEKTYVAARARFPLTFKIFLLYLYRVRAGLYAIDQRAHSLHPKSGSKRFGLEGAGIFQRPPILNFRHVHIAISAARALTQVILPEVYIDLSRGGRERRRGLVPRRWPSSEGPRIHETRSTGRSIRGVAISPPALLLLLCARFRAKRFLFRALVSKPR